ncbi:actin regulatory protein [Rhizoctonia solani]|uniref:Actin regulatory protein n=1 Tax=Rhizoctonia solani TaxID=456999 RepID=A0A8H8SWY0_9AGAM|nr:actin regulatory protein [Rhizoctonia solani]QRW21491.1 actin regulatory protein [Rhizoctonia solani]
MDDSDTDLKNDIGETNIALWGSDLHQRVRERAGDVESAWDDIGQDEGLWIWRIEDFKVVPWPDDRKGQFYDGDSYIILHVSYVQENPWYSSFAHDLHFWLGSQTSLDEAGTAAYKTVELDDHLGGLPTQYRECQYYESQRFRSYFPQGIRILTGGVRTGFSHPEPDTPRPPKLFQITANSVTEVPLPVKYLEEGDVYVFEPGGEANTPPAIMQYNAKGSTGKERFKAAEVSKELAGELGEVQVYDGDASVPFFRALDIPYPPEAPSRGQAGVSEPILLRILPSATPPYTPLPTVTREALDPSDIFILAGPKAIYVWMGSQASREEKRTIMAAAQGFIKEKGLRPETSIVRVVEGNETKAFWDTFPEN